MPLRTIVILIATLLLAHLAGCSRSRPPIDPDYGMLTPEEIADARRMRQRPDPAMKHAQRDFTLQATIVAPGRLQVTLENRTQTEQEVSPLFFRITVPPNSDLIPPDIRSQETFPVGTIGPAQQVNGHIQFPPEATTPGARLIFHPIACRTCQPALAELQTPVNSATDPPSR